MTLRLRSMSAVLYAGLCLAAVLLQLLLLLPAAVLGQSLTFDGAGHAFAKVPTTTQFLLFNAQAASRSLQFVCPLSAYPGLVQYTPTAISSSTSNATSGNGTTTTSYSVYAVWQYPSALSNPVIRRYSFTSQAGACPAYGGYDTLGGSSSLSTAADSQGSYALDTARGYLYGSTPTSQYVLQWSTSTLQQVRIINAYNPPLYMPQGVVVDSQSLLYVSDFNRVVQFDSNGVQLQQMWGPNRGWPSSSSYMLLDPTNGDFIVQDASAAAGPGGALRRFSKDGLRSSVSYVAPRWRTVQGDQLYNISYQLVGAQAAVSSTGDVYLFDMYAQSLTDPSQAVVIVPPSSFTSVAVVPPAAASGNSNGVDARTGLSAAVAASVLLAGLGALLA